MKITAKLTLLALALLLVLSACGDHMNRPAGSPSSEPVPTSSMAAAVSPEPSISPEPDASAEPEPDPLALDEGDELIFYHTDQNYTVDVYFPYGIRLAENWVKMTRAEEEEYFGISFDLTDAVPDLAITGLGIGCDLGLGLYQDEFSITYDIIGFRYGSESRHRTLWFYVGREWPVTTLSDANKADKIPLSLVNGVEVKILSYTQEYWEIETEEGWEAWWEGEPDRPEGAVYYSGPYYQASFECNGNLFFLEATGLTEEEFGRILKHFTM